MSKSPGGWFTMQLSEVFCIRDIVLRMCGRDQPLTGREVGRQQHRNDLQRVKIQTARVFLLLDNLSRT
jgi:hypothetical protein